CKMNRALVILLVVVVAAGYLGTLIAQDPGYVLIAYGEYSMQTSLWVMLGLVLTITLLVYLALRVTGIIRRVPAAYLGWRGHQQTQRASNLTIKGQKLLAEGEYQRARKFLDSGALNNESQALNYLAAARAADKMGDGEARESYLRKAVEIDIGLSRARSVVAAELALARGEPEVALKMLKDTKSNDHILQIKQKSIQAASSWSDGLLTVPEMRKTNPAVALAIEKEAAAAGLSDASLSDNARHDLFRNLSAELKKDPTYIALYVRGLNDRDVVEPVLRAALKKFWNPELVALYGELGESTLQIRLKTVENWQT
ncbi:uncharacterized protein METZ01_LOCUS359687, partial [marine metagenome]